MLNYFIRNRHGVITVFTSIILIAILSFSSLLMELGRKRNIDAYFQEAVEKSAFAMLSGYDRNLYKRFALLAMNPQVDDDTLNNMFKNYMKANLNYELKDNSITPKALDQTVALKDTSIEGMYSIADADVLKSQIEEITKYRSPYSLVENSLNLESSLKEFVKSIEKTVPMVSYLKEATEIGKILTEVTKKAISAKTASEDLSTAAENYKQEIENYNDAVTAYNDAVADLDTSADNYDEMLDALQTSMSASATALQTKISAYITAITSYLKAINEFETAFNQMVTDGVVTALRIRTAEEMAQVAAANDQNNLGCSGYAQWTQPERDEYNKFLNKIYNADGSTEMQNVLQSIKDGLKSVKEAPYEQLKTDLASQRDSIEFDEWTELSVIEKQSKWYESLIGLIEIAITLVSIIDKLVQFFEEIIDAYKSMADILSSVKLIKGALLPADDLYNDSISSVADSLPSNNQTTGSPTSVANDKNKVEKQLDKTNNISQKLGYNIDGINPQNAGENSDFYNAAQAFSTAYERYYSAEERFSDACNTLNILGIIVGLLEWIISTVNLTASLINFLSKARSIGDILGLVYSKIVVSDYAARMFPNRTSSLSSDVSLLGDKWSSYSAYWSDTSLATCKSTVDTDNFSLARGEYIYGGNLSETSNQEKMYNSLFTTRCVLNIIPILMSQSAMQMLEDVFSVPYVGWLLAILLFLGMIMAETYIDLAFMIGGAKKIPIIKINAWLFSKEGLKNLANNLKGILTSNNAKNLMSACIDSYQQEMSGYGLGSSSESDGGDDGGGDKGYLENHGISFNTKIGYWGYTDYLMLFIVFQPEGRTLNRIADLIQLEMNAFYKKQSVTSYDLTKANTYIRVTAKSTYDPVLPIISVPGDKIFNLEQLYYAGY